MSKLTALGKVLRKMRIDREQRMVDMAKAGGISVSFLSAIETGTKPPPDHLIERIGAAYKLPNEQLAELRQLALASIQEVRIRLPEDGQSREYVAMFARRMAGGDLTTEECETFRKFIEG